MNIFCSWQKKTLKNKFSFSQEAFFEFDANLGGNHHKFLEKNIMFGVAEVDGFS